MKYLYGKLCRRISFVDNFPLRMFFSGGGGGVVVITLKRRGGQIQLKGRHRQIAKVSVCQWVPSFKEAVPHPFPAHLT